MSDDDIAKAVSVLLLASYAGIAIWRRAWIAPLNLIVSAAVLVFWAIHFSDFRGAVPTVWVWTGLEVAILVVSALAVWTHRVPGALLWIAFAIHAVLTALFALFMFTFKIDRMM